MSAGSVHVTENYSETMSPQPNSAHNFNFDNPAQAMAVYARIMHERTKKQLSNATNSARRRSEGYSPDSSNDSVHSVGSTRS